MSTPPSTRARSDTHFHLFSAGEAQPGARYVPPYDAAFDQWRRVAAAAGIHRGVLVQPSFLGTDNRRLLAELAAHPEQLRGIAVVDPACTAAVLRGLHAAGVRGVRLNLSGRPHDGAGWHDAALWDALLEVGWHLELHTDPGALPQVLSWLPAQLPVVVDHMAKPRDALASDPTVAALRHRAGVAPVHVKLSGAYRLHGPEAGAVARVLLAELGDASLLWGSDWPCTNHEQWADYARLLESLHEWVGDVAAQAALGPNADALYWR